MQLTELSIKSQNVFVQHYIDGKEEMSSFLITIFTTQACGVKDLMTCRHVPLPERN